MNPKAQLQYFKSNIDGKLSPCAICATDDNDDPKPLIIEVSPGALGDLQRCLDSTLNIADIARRNGKSCVALRPTARGSGTVYQQYGEVDLFEAIEHAKSLYNIDENRISVTGGSMGGAATFYLASHYPDVFASAVPLCGYCDYRLWEKPGGHTFHMQEWEEPSWISRSAAFLPENFYNTAIWMIHGEWDRAIGGGVPVEHSRQMTRLFEEKNIAYKYTEVPETGHSCNSPELYEKVVLWMLEQKKDMTPRRVLHSTCNLRHNRSHWLTIDQFEKYGEKATVEAHIEDTDCKCGHDHLTVQTGNVRTVSFREIEGFDVVSVKIDGQKFKSVNLEKSETFYKDSFGQWCQGKPDLSDQKRHGVAGPIGDMFMDGTILVRGTSGTAEETHMSEVLSRNASGYYRKRNGGVHRGGIMGDTEFALPVIEDRELSEEERKGNNLILYGNAGSNSIFAQYADQLPIKIEGNTIEVGGKSFTAPGCAIFAVFPHPENPNRYVAVNAGKTPDAHTWSSHFDMNLLPDYIVYAGGDLLEWGFWGNDWKSQE